jgi:hypothetical protein
MKLLTSAPQTYQPTFSPAELDNAVREKSFLFQTPPQIVQLTTLFPHIDPSVTGDIVNENEPALLLLLLCKMLLLLPSSPYLLTYLLLQNLFCLVSAEFSLTKKVQLASVLQDPTRQRG